MHLGNDHRFQSVFLSKNITSWNDRYDPAMLKHTNVNLVLIVLANIIMCQGSVVGLKFGRPIEQTIET